MVSEQSKTYYLIENIYSFATFLTFNFDQILRIVVVATASLFLVKKPRYKVARKQNFELILGINIQTYVTVT